MCLLPFVTKLHIHGQCLLCQDVDTYSKRAHHLQVLLHRAPHISPVVNVLLRSWGTRGLGSSCSPASSHVTLSKSFPLS